MSHCRTHGSVMSISYLSCFSGWKPKVPVHPHHSGWDSEGGGRVSYWVRNHSITYYIATVVYMYYYSTIYITYWVWKKKMQIMDLSWLCRAVYFMMPLDCVSDCLCIVAGFLSFLACAALTLCTSTHSTHWREWWSRTGPSLPKICSWASFQVLNIWAEPSSR